MPTPDATAADRAALSDEVTALMRRISRWTARSWRVRSGGGTRSDAVFTLVQELADLSADAEQRARRRVPRLDDTVLPDQLAVMVHDLFAAAPPRTLAVAVEAVRRTRSALPR